MSKDITKKGFLERIPSFSLILIMAGGIDGDWNGAGTATASRL